MVNERLDTIYGDDWVDVTDKVECYEKGKTFECDCGQGFGTEFETSSLKCPSCGRVVVDRKHEHREAKETESEQTDLSDWT